MSLLLWVVLLNVYFVSYRHCVVIRTAEAETCRKPIEQGFRSVSVKFVIFPMIIVFFYRADNVGRR